MIALDSSVLIDVLTNDATHGDASSAKVISAMERDDVVVCDIVLAEVAARVNPIDELMDSLAEMGVNFSPMSEQAAMRAGIMQRRFRERGGKRGERVIADFLIGSHALLHCNALITRDNGFYRDYFKGLKIIDPTN